VKFFKQLFSKSEKKTKGEPAPPDRWTIGIYSGESLSSLCSNGPNPVISPQDLHDVDARLVADPFMMREGELWHLFFEAEVNTPEGPIGKIGHAESRDGLDWSYRGIVLEAPFHLSYPYVFRHGSDILMVPETRADRCIRLYKAQEFPNKWGFVKKLLKGRRFADNSLFEYDNRWWMFTDSGNHTLRLYYATDIAGPWKEHRQSPILKKNPNHARPGGRVFIEDGTPIRFAQDAYPVYGSQVWGFKIECLTTKTYRETPITDPIIQGSGSGWNGKGMHTIDPHRQADGTLIACVDGLAMP